MKRFAFKMFLRPGCEEEYQRRHAALWPELKAQIKASGVSNYSIFFDPDTHLLFGYQEVADGAANTQDAAEADEITRRWWDMMKDLMDTNADNSPVTKPLREVFHLD